MANNQPHIDSFDESYLPKEFKIRMYNGVAWGTILITIILSILHFIIGDSFMVISSLFFYIIISAVILISNVNKKYKLSEFIINIFYPLAFFFSAIIFGQNYSTEYFLLITSVVSIFIFNKNKTIAIFIIYNTLILLLCKLYYYLYPTSIFELKQSSFIQHIFNVINSLIILILLIFIISAIIKKNRYLYSQLTSIQQDQDKIILERTQQLKQTNEEISRFTHISAHDLREPLRNIMSFSQLLERGVTRGNNENNKEYIDYIKKNTNRIDTITKDIVYYTEIENRSKRVEIIDLSEVVQNIFENQKESDLNLSIHNLPKIKMNRNLCYDLFSQLIQNAITYSDKKEKEVIVTCIQKEDFYLFSIRDNGNGIPEELINSIFVMFKRLQNNLNHKGSGNGLAVCKKIINAYNGKIWAESNIEKGSTFYFTFPIDGILKDKSI